MTRMMVVPLLASLAGGGCVGEQPEDGRGAYVATSELPPHESGYGVVHEHPPQAIDVLLAEADEVANLSLYYSDCRGATHSNPHLTPRVRS